MDAFDLKILSILAADGRVTNEAISERIGLSASQCYRRRLKLEQTGAIQGYRAIIDPQTIGLSVGAYLHLGIVSQSKHDRQKFAAFITSQPTVLSCHAVTGDADYILRVNAKDLPDLNRFLLLLLAHGNDRMHVRSLVILSTLKDDLTSME